MAEKRSELLSDLSLEASGYFQKCVPFLRLSPSPARLADSCHRRRYDWLLLRTLVTIGYLGFIAFLAQTILASSLALPPSSSSRFPIAAGLPIGAFTSLCARFAVERAPSSHYPYAFLPSAFWLAVLRDPAPFAALARTARTSTTSLARLCASTGAVVLSLLALAYGYSDRRAFALIALGMGAVWPVSMLAPGVRAARGTLLSRWAAAMAALAVFPLLPVEKGENLSVVCVPSRILPWRPFVP